VLTTANIADDATLKKSIAFCDEQGITSVSDMVEYNLVQDFVRHLGLKNVPGKKLLSMLQTPTSGLAAQLSDRLFSPSSSRKSSPESVAQQARIADVADEPLELMGPITGVMKCVRLSLMDAAAASGVEDIDAHAFMASRRGRSLPRPIRTASTRTRRAGCGCTRHRATSTRRSTGCCAHATAPPSSPSSRTCS